MSIANFSRCALGSLRGQYYARRLWRIAAYCEPGCPAAFTGLPCTPARTRRKKTFHYTGAAQTFAVPAHVTELAVTAAGASGASGGPSSGYGGQGGMRRLGARNDTREIR